VGPLFLAILSLSFLEFLLLGRIGRWVGLPSTLLFVMAMAMLGAALAKTMGGKLLRAWRDALATGSVPEEGVLSGVLMWVGAVLLIIPGVLSDVAGLLCLLPPTRRALAAALGRYLAHQSARGTVQTVGFEWPGSSPHPTPDMPRARVPRSHPRARRDTRPFPRTGRDDIIDTDGEEV
jgi:UPF0716 protein FxsA